MKKMLVVFCLVIAFSLTASADKFYNFTFRDPGGNPFCDGLSLHLITAGGQKNLVDGAHIGCVSENIVGVKSGVSANLQFNNIGAAMVISDPESIFFPDATMWVISINSRTWALYQNGGGGVFLNSVGTWINGANATSKNAKPAGSR